MNVTQIKYYSNTVYLGIPVTLTPWEIGNDFCGVLLQIMLCYLLSYITSRNLLSFLFIYCQISLKGIFNNNNNNKL